jgi:DNA-binding NarL/FixJ family response regulator
MKKAHQSILIVDDNMNFIKRVIRLLNDVENIGPIKVANNYEEAFAILINEKPELILLDINLKEKSGIELLTKIRQMNIECKVIMVSNHADEYYKKECKELGADYFLDKSNDFNQLPGLIKTLQLA